MRVPTFEFVAIDRSGQTRSGTLASPNSESVRKILTRRGLVATSVTPTTHKETAARSMRLGANSLALITRQLATLLTVSTVEESLRMLAEQADNRRQHEALTRVHAGVLEGLRLSEAMARLGPAFPPTYRAMVAAGETSGSLPNILERLADLLEKRQDMHAKVTSALVYPIVLAIVAICVIVALMTFVVPKVVDQFDMSGQRLPFLTQAVIAISDVMLNWGWLIALSIGGLLAAAATLLSRPGPRRTFDAMLLGFPVIGRMLRNAESTSFARSMSTMIASGLPVLDALQLTSRTVGNRVFKDAIEDMAVGVHEGSSLSSAMRRARVFPPLLVNLAASGEGGGRLEPMLDRAADYLEREFRTATSVALSLLEPAIIVVMGGIVCLVILSILLPILQINTLSL